MTLVPTPAYTVAQDYKDYVDSVAFANDAAINKALARAEHYVDLLAAGLPMVWPGTDTTHSLDLTGNPTGGTINLSVTFNGVVYTSNPILWNDSYTGIANALNGMVGFPGSFYVVGGPLPYSTVYISYLGGAAQGNFIPVGTVVNNLNTGGANFAVSAAGGVPGRRFRLSQLQAQDIVAVKSAVCAQVEYMGQMDSSLFSGAQYSQVRGPDFTTNGRLPVVAPKARRELALAGLTFTTTRSRA